VGLPFYRQHEEATVKTQSSWNDRCPALVLAFIICLPTAVGLAYQLFH